MYIPPGANLSTTSQRRSWLQSVDVPDDCLENCGCGGGSAHAVLLVSPFFPLHALDCVLHCSAMSTRSSTPAISETSLLITCNIWEISLKGPSCALLCMASLSLSKLIWPRSCESSLACSPVPSRIDRMSVDGNVDLDFDGDRNVYVE